MNLPPLPEPADFLQVIWRGDREFARPVGYYYTTDQLRAYAAEAVRVALEQAAQAAEAEAIELIGDGDEAYNMALQHAAAAIRVLKDKP